MDSIVIKNKSYSVLNIINNGSFHLQELPDVQEVTKTEELESSSKHLAGLINDYRSEVGIML